ncbi:hypothetical protein BG015_000868 [Linnemannia schmuckeri]|uniref:Uncharacterized protein n=1 Tax=Linnemannia schmuckeri TaxID=64567 RepID=A0A9P5S4M3_9FUNG|nr:hypothetical protein BG015_000868 [Linnemannia schmuckeri]
MPPKFSIKENFEIQFADPPDAAKLLKHVLKRDRGVDYTGGSAFESHSSGSDNEGDADQGEQQRQQRQQQQRQSSSKTTTSYESSQARFTRLIVKKDGSHQRYICLAFRFLLEEIPILLRKPFVVSQGVKSGEWVGAFSPLKSGVCMDRLMKNLAAAEPQLRKGSPIALYSFYTHFVSMGKELLDILEEGPLTKQGDDNDYLRSLRQGQQSGWAFRRTFVSEAAMQLARLDREYRRRLGEKGSSRKRKADLSFADDIGAASDLEVDWEAAIDDGQDHEEMLKEDDKYRTPKRIATVQSPAPQPVTTEAQFSPSTSTSPSSASTLPSTISQQQPQQIQQYQQEPVSNDRVALEHGHIATISDAGPEPPIAFSREAYNKDKVTAEQLSRTLENTMQEQSHLNKVLANLQQMLAHSRQLQRARFFFADGHSAHNSHLDQSRVNNGAGNSAATTTAASTQQYQQQSDLSSLCRSSTSTLPSTLTNSPVFTDSDSTNATSSDSNTFSAKDTSQASSHTSGSKSSLEDAIRSFSEDLKVQITSLKNAFQNQQLQMIHLQDAVETQQTQLSAIQDTLNILVKQSTPSNNHINNDNGIISTLHVADGLALTEAESEISTELAVPPAQAVSLSPSPAVQAVALTPATPAPVGSLEVEKTQPGTASAHVRRRTRQKYKLSTSAIPGYAITAQQQPQPIPEPDADKIGDSSSALVARGTTPPTTAAVALTLAEAGARSTATSAAGNAARAIFY